MLKVSNYHMQQLAEELDTVSFELTERVWREVIVTTRTKKEMNHKQQALDHIR